MQNLYTNACLFSMPSLKTMIQSFRFNRVTKRFSLVLHARTFAIDTVGVLIDEHSEKQLYQGNEKEKANTNLIKRYHKFARALWNDTKKCENKNDEDLDLFALFCKPGVAPELKNYIYAKSYKDGLAGSSHIVVANKSKPSFLKRAIEAYSLDREMSFIHSYIPPEPEGFLKRKKGQQPVPKKEASRATSLSFFRSNPLFAGFYTQLGVGRGYRRVPLSALSFPFSQQSKTRSLPATSVVNTHRERVRKARVLVLQRCTSKFTTNDQHVQETSQKNREKITTNSLEKHNNPTLFKNSKTNTKSVCKGFVNTFMRDGNKLRYQSLLRKALFVL